VADLDTALVQPVLGVAEREREPEYNITAGRMISGLVLNHLNGLYLVMARRYRAPCPASRRVSLTVPMSMNASNEGPTSAKPTAFSMWGFLLGNLKTFLF
jgi:hypothetical protein